MRLQQPEMTHSPAYYQRGSSGSGSGAGAGAEFQQPPLDFSTVPASRSTTPGSSGHRSSQIKHKSGESMGSARGSMADPSRRPSMILENGTGAGSGSPLARKERPRRSVSEYSPSRTYADDDNQDALVMLFRLSLPIPFYSIAASIYTFLALLFTILVAPFRLSLRTSRAQLCDLLVPALHVHERLIGLGRWSPPDSHSRNRHSHRHSHHSHQRQAGEDLDEDLQHPDGEYSIGWLLVVLLLSPLLALAMLLLAWIAAFFWVFALLLGNPDGTERKDDGRAAVLGVSRWWRIWLGRARAVF